ncbi:TetR/AcrR family transcriptional regulator [Chitinophaga qingshengii]|uniref:TetR/AcrR family transcriptional regulator n=1 Tax=Chitinophaga qingshengii TaxID=1569794 RepID=A0ABR7TM12_9BACT|nr:TetR/AcrR family transcriptional regulator [Chitinophaga qingshengii]MBC9931535.1 TetR/AcrR family transcriptional regulator [Chitinophaga qingshengii]
MHTENKDEMRDKILEAALKRFTHYGAAKTTMNEIADDLHCSKASLYYYFPDKKAMHLAVLEKIAEAYFAEMQKVTSHITSAAQALHDIIEVKKGFISKFCRLEIFKIQKDGPSVFLEGVKRAKQIEIGLTTNVIKAGIASGEFKVDNAELTGDLLVQSLMGLRFSVPDHLSNDEELDEATFERVIEKQKLLLDIFIKGMQA